MKFLKTNYFAPLQMFNQQLSKQTAARERSLYFLVVSVHYGTGEVREEHTMKAYGADIIAARLSHLD